MVVCSFAQEILDKFGKKALCNSHELKYEDCEGECIWGSKCSDCKQPRVWSFDPCTGATLLCLNQDCPMDK